MPSLRHESVVAYLGLGANLGEPTRQLDAAVAALRAVPGIDVRRVSSYRTTAPVLTAWDGPPQPDFVNGAVEIATVLPPAALLAVVRALERRAGRDHDAPREAPRPLDIDVLTYGDERVDTRDLVVPHPRLADREFVLEPLRELGVDLDAIRVQIEAARDVVVWVDPVAMRDGCAAWRAGGCRVGLVPTMGALHAGHASLFARARAECDRVVATIFVNPKQFGAGEDFGRYPRPTDADLGVLRAERVDAVFMPGVDAMYPPGFCSEVEVGAEAAELEGARRPGHFRGVATVVAKLWVLAAPDVAYFGAKDAQQVAVLRRLHADLGLSGTVAECAIVREDDGLALSSRNVYLDAADRAAAPALFRALAAMRSAWRDGERSPNGLRAVGVAHLDAEPRCELEYLEVRGAEDLRAFPDAAAPIIDAAARAVVAARFGSTRLIDNLRLDGVDA